MSRTAYDLTIFDMDGTLLDSMDCLVDWIHRAVKNRCHTSVTPAAITAAFGPTEGQIIERFVGDSLTKTCLDLYYELYEREHNRGYVYPGIDGLLKALKAKGIPLALCTGKSRRAVDISLRLLGWESLFQVIVTGDDTKRFKPDPEGINLILTRIKADRPKTLFIGDSAADTAAAVNAGVHSGRAQWGVTDSSLPPLPAPNYIFKEPRDVRENVLL